MRLLLGGWSDFYDEFLSINVVRKQWPKKSGMTATRFQQVMN